MPGGGHTAPFEPQEHDVVSTKLRSWNLGHTGNLLYAELLVEYALKLPLPSATDYTAVLSQVTRELVEAIANKGGRFLKIAEGENHPDECIVMDYKACHHKVLNGLKNKQRVILTKGIPPKPTKKMEPPTKHQRFKSSPNPPRDSSKRVVRKRRPFDDDEEGEEAPKPKRQQRRRRLTRYEATQGENGSIHPYALELISYVCNNNRAEPILLDKPGPQYSTTEEESEKERLIRLQVGLLLLLQSSLLDDGCNFSYLLPVFSLTAPTSLFCSVCHEYSTG